MGGGRPWRRAAAWLLLLGPFFFASYGFATWVTDQRADVGVWVFEWERRIPFIAWTILPYWSIDLLYGLSLFLLATKVAVDTHGKRLLTAQVVAVSCFLLFPLRFSFERPQAGGWAGMLFDLLGQFDKPYNQAPSLHIALLVILWVVYARAVPRTMVWPLHAWFALIGLSVLTTFQHHFVDIPTGAALGLFCLWLWSDQGTSPLAQARWTRDARRRRMAMRYAAGSAACAALAWMTGGFGTWMAWPALSLAMVAANYAAIGPLGFQKGPDGRLSLAATLLFAPYLIGARINTMLWPGDGRRQAGIRDGVSIGRLPSAQESEGYAGMVDLCAELPASARPSGYAAVPLLDLVTPEPDRLRAASDRIEAARQQGTVLVCCALGYSRSAAAAATWLLRSGRAADVEEAVAQLRAVRPNIVLHDDMRAAIAEAARP